MPIMVPFRLDLSNLEHKYDREDKQLELTLPCMSMNSPVLSEQFQRQLDDTELNEIEVEQLIDDFVHKINMRLAANYLVNLIK